MKCDICGGKLKKNKHGEYECTECGLWAIPDYEEIYDESLDENVPLKCTDCPMLHDIYPHCVDNCNCFD